MADKDKRYYWLKLKKDFFKRHDIQIIENMPNGKDYLLFYLKLLCESVDHEGNLRFSEQIPYNENMLSIITNTNVDIVRNAITVFSQLQMMEVMDDGTYYMTEVNKMIGSETYWAQRKREQRELELEEIGQCPTVSNEFPTCPSKSKRKSKSIDNKEINKENVTSSAGDFEKAWNNTVDRYPKKRREATAKQIWMNRLLAVKEEERKQLATDIYKAIALFLANHRETHSDDEKYEYIPKFDEWLTEDCDYWLRQLAEERRKQ